MLEQLNIGEFNSDVNGGVDKEGEVGGLEPSEIHEYLKNVLYARRSKMDPLWNTFLVGGVGRDGKRCRVLAPFPWTIADWIRFCFDRFLAYADLLGTTYSASTLASGYGAYIAQPLLRAAVEGREDTLTEEEGTKLMEECLRVMWYRDARSLDKVSLCPSLLPILFLLFFSSTKHGANTLGLL